MSEVRSAIVKLIADVSNYRSGMAQAEASTSKLKSELASTTGGLRGAAVAGTNLKNVFGAMAGLAVVKSFKDLAQMAGEDAKGQEILASALRKNVGATKEQIAANENWIESMTRASGIADDKLRPALGFLVTAGRNVEQAHKDVALAADIAAARNMDLETVARAMAKAAQGQTTALGRLGIKTKDAAGEALSYDEILQEAAKTMGGTAASAALSLGGQLERQKIQWEETKEAIGAKFITPLGRLGDAFNLFVSDLTDTDTAATRVTIGLNELVRNGIDPTANKAASMAAVLGESIVGKSGDAQQAVEQLTLSLGLTTAEVAVGRQAFIDYATANGESEDDIRKVTDALDYYLRSQDYANASTQRGTMSQEQYAAAVRDSRLAVAEGTNVALAWFSANQRLEAAQLKVTEAVKEFGSGSVEAAEAGMDLARSQAEVNAAQAGLADYGTPAAIEALKTMMIQAGLSKDVIDDLIGSMQGFVGAASAFSTIPAIKINTSKTQNSFRASGGPVTGRHPYIVGEEGPELFVPTAAGRIVPNDQLGGSTRTVQINQTFERVDGDHVDRDIQRGLTLAQLSRLAETLL